MLKISSMDNIPAKRPRRSNFNISFKILKAFFFFYIEFSHPGSPRNSHARKFSHLSRCSMFVAFHPEEQKRTVLVHVFFTTGSIVLLHHAHHT